MNYRVQLTAEARRQLQEIDEWWTVNRPKAPALVLRELARARDVVALDDAMAGKVYRRATSASYRRLLLRRSRFHVYYMVDEGERAVRIVAIWNAVRGHGPDLP